MIRNRMADVFLFFHNPSIWLKGDNGWILSPKVKPSIRHP